MASWADLFARSARPCSCGGEADGAAGGGALAADVEQLCAVTQRRHADSVTPASTACLRDGGTAVFTRPPGALPDRELRFETVLVETDPASLRWLTTDLVDGRLGKRVVDVLRQDLAQRVFVSRDDIRDDAELCPRSHFQSRPVWMCHVTVPFDLVCTCRDRQATSRSE